jgi:nucleoside-diphosphate-sugar epimerase
VLRGDLDDVEILQSGAKRSDAVIHLAYKHAVAFTPDGFAQAAQSDGQAIEAMGEALAGSERPLIIASGTPAVPGRLATESDDISAFGPVALRGANARAAIALASRGVRSSVVRLPRSVHGEGDVHGFIPRLIAIAREKGVSGYVGDGSSRWPAVHVSDAAHLFRLAVERAPAGSVWHAVGDEAVPTREIAEVIGRKLNLPTTPAPADQFGFLGTVLASDQPASSTQTRTLLDWQPVRPGLIADMESGHYFAPVHEAPAR